MNPQPIIVKFLTKTSRLERPDKWVRQFPGQDPVWGRCRFIFDPDARQYDWLAVYDELPKAGEKQSLKNREELACPRSHTILITAEPSSIKMYGRRFVEQFGCVLTSQESWALPHANAIRSQPALRWFYGVGTTRIRSFDELAQHPPLDKSRVISIAASSKQQGHTLHRQRYRFAHQLKELLPELEVFGRGVRDMDDKAEALDAYCYHVAVENHRGPHHWTEKLADSFLGCCLPFYYGCPNPADYFPAESFIPIDIFDVKGAAQIIRSAIEQQEYEKRLPAIMEARRRVMHEFNLFAVLSRLIEQRHSRAAAVPGSMMFGRHAMRATSFMELAEGLIAKVRGRLGSGRGRG